MINLDRFPAPNANDEMVRCVWCQNKFNYQALNSEGYCPDCAPETKEEEDMTENEMNERNAWIAEHVMEWRRVNFALSSKDSFCVMDTGVYIYASPNSMAPFSPTTDAAAALQVLEKCAEKTEQLECMYLGKIEDEWVVGIHDLMIEATADTLSLAICTFAQKLFTHETKT